MDLDELEAKIEEFILASRSDPSLELMLPADDLSVIKYIPSRFLNDVLSNQHLYASERIGFTWGDAIYVAPLSFPRSTMMYGDVGVVGSYSVNDGRFFNAGDSLGVSLYQQWIAYQVDTYRDLTTTVHANLANRTLRNDFRTKFQIDCVYFRPDEECAEYVDAAKDWWLAITHWDAYRIVGSGFSTVIKNLKWCLVGPDSFTQEGRGYKAALHKTTSTKHQYVSGHYSSLASDVQAAYSMPSSHVVICDFN
jgi:hypothetical protein